MHVHIHICGGWKPGVILMKAAPLLWYRASHWPEVTIRPLGLSILIVSIIIQKTLYEHATERFQAGILYPESPSLDLRTQSLCSRPGHLSLVL